MAWRWIPLKTPTAENGPFSLVDVGGQLTYHSCHLSCNREKLISRRRLWLTSSHEKSGLGCFGGTISTEVDAEEKATEESPSTQPLKDLIGVWPAWGDQNHWGIEGHYSIDDHHDTILDIGSYVGGEEMGVVNHNSSTSRTTKPFSLLMRKRIFWTVLPCSSDSETWSPMEASPVPALQGTGEGSFLPKMKHQERTHSYLSGCVKQC